MSARGKPSDKATDKAAEVKPVSERVVKQVDEGKEDLAQTTKDYYKARREGLRDIHTGALRGDQPQFFDSEKPEVADKGTSTAVADKAADSERTGDDDDSLPQESPEDEAGEALTARSPEEESVENIEGGPVKDLDGEGRPTKIEYPDGTSAEVSYDKDGKPNEIKFSNDKAGVSFEMDADGKVTSEKRSDGTELKFKYDEKGELTHIEDNKGHAAEKGEGDNWKHYNKDGKEKVDGSKIGADKDGDITDMHRPQGGDSKFQCNGEGELTGYTTGEGVHYNKQGDGTWKSDPPGSGGKGIGLDGDGNVTQTKTGGGKEAIHTDGTVHIEYPSGVTGEATSEREVTSMTTPSGRKFDIGDESAETTAGVGDTYAKIAEDSLIVHNSMKPGYKPSPAERAAEAEAIKAKDSGVTEPIASGTKIVIASSDE